MMFLCPDNSGLCQVGKTKTPQTPQLPGLCPLVSQGIPGKGRTFRPVSALELLAPQDSVSLDSGCICWWETPHPMELETNDLSKTFTPHLSSLQQLLRPRAGVPSRNLYGRSSVLSGTVNEETQGTLPCTHHPHSLSVVLHFSAGHLHLEPWVC